MKRNPVCYCFFALLLAVAGVCNKSNVYGYIQLTGYEASNPSIVYLPETISQLSGFVYYPRGQQHFLH
jgi:hypothetical protein